MSAELIGILSAGVALLGLGLRLSSRLDDVDRRLARVEGLLEGLGLSRRVTSVPSPGEQSHAFRRPAMSCWLSGVLASPVASRQESTRAVQKFCGKDDSRAALYCGMILA